MLNLHAWLCYCTCRRQDKEKQVWHDPLEQPWCHEGGQTVCHFEVMFWNRHGRHISGAPPGDLYSHIWGKRCNACRVSSSQAWITMVNFEIPQGIHETCSSHTDWGGYPSLAHVCVMYSAAVRRCQYTHLGNCILLLLPAPCREDWW